MTKSRNKFALLIAFVLCFSLALGLMVSIDPDIANAQEQVTLTEDQRSQIESMIFEVAEQDGYSFESMEYAAKNIYFANEMWAGYLIEFTADATDGYAIIFDTNGLKLIELIIGRHSPYFGKQGKYIYPSLGNYVIKQGEAFYDAETNIITDYSVDENELFYAACNKKKADVPVTRNVNYSRGYKYPYEISNFYVGYSTSLTSHSNNCANAAGLIMLNYWNKKYVNDILKLDASLLSYSNNIWYDTSTGRDARKDYMGIFYDYMNTNWIFGTGGTLPGDAYSGFERLIKEKGYKVSRNTNLSFADMKYYIDSDIPVFIVSTDYYFSASNNIPNVNATPGNYTLSIDYLRSWGLANAHTFVGYGYAFYDLYDSNGNYFQEKLIKVADGWGGSCYFSMNVGNVYSSAAINVYK